MSTDSEVKQSAVSLSIAGAGAKTIADALPREILHNLQYQHNWTELLLHVINTNEFSATRIGKGSNTSLQYSSTGKTYLISGLPPRHTYVHPDFLNHLVLNKIEESDVQIQREWVLPMNIGGSWTLRKFASIFDSLPARDPIEGKPGFKHYDVKRIICGMKARDGSGGDGTVVYYIMQEGEVKPRQN